MSSAAAEGGICLNCGPDFAPLRLWTRLSLDRHLADVVVKVHLLWLLDGGGDGREAGKVAIQLH